MKFLFNYCTISHICKQFYGLRSKLSKFVGVGTIQNTVTPYWGRLG